MKNKPELLLTGALALFLTATLFLSPRSRADVQTPFAPVNPQLLGLTQLPSMSPQGTNLIVIVTQTNEPAGTSGTLVLAPVSSISGAISGILLSSIGQSGAASNQVVQWNGSAWVPADVSQIISNVTLVSVYSTSNFVNYSFLTNITAVTINSTTINVSGKATLNQIIITNGIFSATNTWAGPTNTVNMSVYEQNYVTVTPCNFSGFINYSNSLASQVFLQIANNASTNITVTWPAALVMNVAGALGSSATITNGTVGCFWLHYTPQGPRTNGVFQQL